MSNEYTPAPQDQQAEAVPDGLIDALRSGQQADMDGTMVKVSRQACEMAADMLERLTVPTPQADAAPSRDEALRAENERLREENAIMAAALDEGEREHGLSSNGGFWRFWSEQLRKYHQARADERAALEDRT